MVEGAAEIFRARPRRMAEAWEIRGDEAIPGAKSGFQHGLIHAGRGWNAMEQKNNRAACGPGFAIEDVKTIHLDGFVGNTLPTVSVDCVHKHCQASDS